MSNWSKALLFSVSKCMYIAEYIAIVQSLDCIRNVCMYEQSYSSCTILGLHKKCMYV